MRTAALLAMTWAIAACGSGDDHNVDAAVPSDAGVEGDSATSGCNPWAMTGCDVADKCSVEWESVEPPAGPVTCVPAGDKAVDQPCTIDIVAGADDCQPGLLCWEIAEGDNRCARFCMTIE